MRTDEEDVHELLRHLDHPMPQVDVHSLMQRAQRQPQRWSGFSRAAGVLLMLGIGGVAWAAPGSPLPGLIAKAAAWIGVETNNKTAAVPTTAGPTVTPPVIVPAKPHVAGVAVAPGSNLVVSFTSSQDIGDLRISLADVPDVSVRTETGAATFTASDGRLVVSNAGSQASFDIEVPVGAARVEIRVAGQLRYVKNGSGITSATATRLGDLYVVPLQSTPGNKR